MIGVRLSRFVCKGDESKSKSSCGQQITLMNFVRRPNELKKKISHESNKEIELVELNSDSSEDLKDDFSETSKQDFPETMGN